MAWMVIRVRGTIHARHDIIETLDFLHLTRPNHATVLPEAASFKGMLVKVQGTSRGARPSPRRPSTSC